MARRIVTARQQYAMLSPWRTAAEDDLPPNQWSQERRDAHEREYMKKLERERLDRRENATKIYRGLRLDLPQELEDFVYEHYRKDVPYSLEEVGGHLVIGPKLLDHLQKSHPNLLNYGNGYGFDGDDKLGLGRHWTVHRQFAEKAAMQGGRGKHQIVIEADRPGPEHRDPNRTGVGDWSSKGESWKEEEEDTLLPGTPLNVTGVKLNGKEVLHDPRLEQRMPKDYDVPLVYPGGPRQQTAAWYHTSPRRLPVGTDLVPGGGRSSYDPYYRAVGEPDRKNHVWVEDDPRLLKRWHDIDADTNYHYRVEPDGDPRPYRDGDYSQGYVVPRARIVEELGPAKRRRKGKLLYHRTTPENAAAINRMKKFNPGLEKGQRPDAVFFSTNPGDDVGQAREYGDGLVTLNVPDEHFEDEYGEFQGGNGWLDDEFPSGEQHWAIPHQHLRPEWFIDPKEQP